MIVKIGSARINEKGTISGGKAGDQTGGEVSTQNWYLHSKGWVVIRPKSTEQAEKIAQCMENACANSHIGYDQSQRNTLYSEASKYSFDCRKVSKNVETDCSALVRVCCKYAGINVGDFNTASEKSTLSATGKFEILASDKCCKSSDCLKRGDILVTKTKGHTVVVLTDGAKAKGGDTVKKIVDISHHHPVTDWNKAKANVELLISKATQGTDYVDPTLDSFIKNCEAKGIPYWLYTFLESGDGKAQAKYLIDKCKEKVGTHFVGYIIDAEKDPATGKRPTDAQAAAAVKYLKAQGVKCGLYTGYADYSLYKDAISEVKGQASCFWWEARYGKNNGSYNSGYPCNKKVDLHQYTSKGSCPGISGSLDLNRITGQGKDLSWFQMPGVAKVEQKPKESTTAKKESGGTYKVEFGLLKNGTKSKQVNTFELCMKAKGYYDGKIDRDYGAKCKAACIKVQKKHGLAQDGECGPLTWPYVLGLK